jgi:quinol monooxygenase YgiN
VSLIIAGTVRVPPENIAGIRPHMAAMTAGSRAEAGCIAYGYAEDVLEPGLIHIFEIWSDQDALNAHAASGHMATWRAAGSSFGVSDRALTLYEIASQRPL